MKENEETQASAQDIADKLKSQPLPSCAFPPAFTHPIEHFRLRCLDLANVESGFAQKPEDIIKTAELYADFVLGASGGIAPKRSPYTVGERLLETVSSLDPGIIEPLTSPSISQAEQRLHTLQRLFDDIEPSPHSVCNLEAAHYKMTTRLLVTTKILKEAQEGVTTLQEEIDNLALDIIQHGNADFLLKQTQPLPVREKWRQNCKRERLWARKAKETAVSYEGV